MSQPLRVIIVEDEILISMMLEEYLADMGHEVVATASALAKATELARTVDCDVAVLDINLGNESSFPVADILTERRIPFVFASGYGATGLAEPYTEARTVRKPFAPDDLASALTAVTS